MWGLGRVFSLNAMPSRAAGVVLALALGQASALHKSPAVPHGLLPRHLSGESKRVHDAVVQAAAHTDDAGAAARACAEHLGHLRALVSSGAHEEALDLAFALHEQSGPAPAHADCRVAEVHLGEGTIATKISTARDKTAPGASKAESFIRLHQDDDAAAAVNALPILLKGDGTDKLRVSSKAREPVLGVSLDGKFLLAAAKARCRAAASGEEGLLCDAGASLRGVKLPDASAALELLSGEGRRLTGHTFMGKPLIPNPEVVAEHRSELARAAAGDVREASSLGDASTTYAIGEKTCIVIPLLPSDGAESMSAPFGYNYGLVASAHGGSITSFIAQVQAS